MKALAREVGRFGIRDIPSTVRFPASEEARYVTGTQMRVDLGHCEK